MHLAFLCTMAWQDSVEKDVDEAIRKLTSDRYSAGQDARTELIEIGSAAVPLLVKTLAEEAKKEADLKKAKDDLDKAEKSTPKKEEEIKKAKDEVERIQKTLANSQQLRHSICEILGSIRSSGKDGEAVKALVAALDDKGEYGTSVASASAAALAWIGDRTAGPALLKVLQDAKRVDTDKPLKYGCIRALGVLRHAEATETLIKALEDKKTTAVDSADEYAHTIAAAAAEALGKIRSKDAIEGLGKLLADETNDPFSQRKLSWHSARALERIEGARKDGALDGDEKQVQAALEAWRKWYHDDFKVRKNVADSKKKVEETAEAIKKFRTDVGRLPLTLLDLTQVPVDPKEKEKWKGPYVKPAADLKKTFHDAWDREMVYRTPGTGTAGTELDFDLFSTGADGRTWGGGFSADIYNHLQYVPVLVQRNKEKFDEVLKAVQQFKTDQERVPNDLRELTTKPADAKKWEKPYLGAAKYDAAVDAIKRFQTDQGRLPKMLQELKEKPADAKKWDKPYLEDFTDAFGMQWMYRPAADGKTFELLSFGMPRDAYENPFQYKKLAKDDFELKSLGADNAEGGTGIDEDVTNKPKEEKKNGQK